MSRHRFAVLLLPLLLASPVLAADAKPSGKAAKAEPRPSENSSLRWNLDQHDMRTLPAEQIAEKSRLVARLDEIGKAARGGDVTAQMLLGIAYSSGIGVPRDMGETEYWASRAAKAGNGRAMVALAVAAEARGDLAGRMDWLRRSADTGNAIAMVRIFLIYLEGDAQHPKDEVRALAWVRRAADAGSAVAMGWIGAAYMNGTGLPQDEVTAVSWIRKAAELGDLQATHMMGQVYLTGRGVPQSDLNVAQAWLRRGIARGDAQCLKLYNEINQAVALDMAVARQRAQASEDSDNELLGLRR